MKPIMYLMCLTCLHVDDLDNRRDTMVCSECGSRGHSIVINSAQLDDILRSLEAWEGEGGTIPPHRETRGKQ